MSGNYPAGYARMVGEGCVSSEPQEDAAAQERAAVLAYLREFYADDPTALADAIERGEHLSASPAPSDDAEAQA